jgi:hypothetical protein
MEKFNQPHEDTVMTNLMRIARNQKQLEHEAFYHGSQNCEPHEALAEIESKFNQKMELVAHKATPQIKQLEATIEDANRRLPLATERLQSITARHKGRLPEIAVPVFMVGMGLFAMLAESGMLAPFMDLFDITNPIWQHLSALAIGCACAVILHLSIESLTPKRFEPNTEKMLRILGVFVLVGLAWAGIARGHQAAFGASLSGSPLGGFLSSNPFLTTTVYTFFTVAFPVAGAVAISFGVKAAREWREFLIARQEAKHLNTVVATVPKQLEGEQKKLSHELTHLDETKKEWQKAYLVQHQRGSSLGALQSPKWMVWVKAGFVALIALLVSMPLMMFPLVPIVLIVAAFVGGYIHFHNAWAHPKPHQLYNQQKVEFRKPNNAGGAE